MDLIIYFGICINYYSMCSSDVFKIVEYYISIVVIVHDARFPIHKYITMHKIDNEVILM